MRILVAGMAALLLSGLAAPQPAAKADSLEQLAWMAGCWEMRRDSRVTLEMWMAPAGGIMLGASRTVNGSRLVEFERVYLAERDGKLVYTALPSRQQEASFTSTRVADDGFTVENPAHDFPQRIIYRRQGRDSLVARIEGPGAGGTTRGVDYPMARVGCEAN